MIVAPESWLIVDRAAGDLAGQIYRGVRDRILRHRLAPGQKLPSSRALAASLGVARSTVVSAYERLIAEGFLSAAPGAATSVSALPQPPRTKRHPADRPDVLPTLPVEPTSGLFRPGVPDVSAFPHAAWARCLASRARALRVHDLGYGGATGLPELRAAILDHVAETRGVGAIEDQVVILPSAAAAIALIARLALQRTSSGRPIAWIEEPGYEKAHALLREAGWRLVPVPCDGHGLDPDRAPGPSPELIYVTPSHQYPSGVTMSLPRRLALLSRAQAEGAIVLEDDYDSEFHDRARPIAALQGIDRNGAVAYVGTFSKVLAPGLRVAYAILPAVLLGRAVETMRLHGSAVPIHVQAALADFIREGRLRAHIRRMTPLYAERMAVVADLLRGLCGEHLRVGQAAGGLQLAAWFLRESFDDAALVSALERQGYGIRALSDFHLGPANPGLLFGIASATPERAKTAAVLVRELIEGEPFRKP